MTKITINGRTFQSKANYRAYGGSVRGHYDDSLPNPFKGIGFILGCIFGDTKPQKIEKTYDCGDCCDCDDCFALMSKQEKEFYGKNK